jgi:phage terminase large subunit
MRAYCDIGGAGARADAFSMWICQFVGGRVNVLNYYEAQGQPLAEHLAWLRANGLDAGKVEIFLPHDGLKEGGPNPGSFESAFKDAGYSATTLRNEGSGATGAKTARIEASRRLFPSIWFDESKCSGGLDALGWYHEKKDEDRGIGLGPEHDWSSHAADAFGLMCVSYEPPRAAKKLDYSGVMRRVV